MRLIQIAGEPVELVLPETPIAGDPGIGLAHGACDEPAAADPAVAAANDQAGPFEHLQVLGNGGKGHAERPGQGADRRLAGGETGKHGASRGIGEGGERRVEPRLILNHMV